MAPPRLAKRLSAIARQRCPVCLEGRMFRGLFTMNATCPVCGHRFEREPGFFQGAMYVSYTLGVGEALALTLAAMFFLVPAIGLGAALACVVAVHLACVPMLFRYSRVIWAHLNIGTLDPSDPSFATIRRHSRLPPTSGA